MSKGISGLKFCDKLCEALGIDAAEKRVTDIIIEASVDERARVTIERYLIDEEAQKVIDLVEQYNLVDAGAAEEA